jgi:iron-sulfur cluster repair protein YtfE (RIC family)
MTQPHACTCAEEGRAARAGDETITSLLTADHRHADALLSDAVQQAAKGEWPQCARQLAVFRAALEAHMKLEEQVLFPAFEQATGSDVGPTAVMRHEHLQMLRMLDEMSQVAVSQARERFDALAPAFTRIIDMHSMKEENVLYPMCDRVLDETTCETLRKTLNELRRVEHM